MTDQKTLNDIREEVEKLKDFTNANDIIKSINEIRKDVLEIPCLKHPENCIIAIEKSSGDSLCSDCIKEGNLDNELFRRLGRGDHPDAGGSP